MARIRATWPWLAEHRPDLYRAILDADEAGDVEGLREAMEQASRVYADRHREASERIYSRLFDSELWIAAEQAAADELRREGVALPILLPEEAMVLGRMAEADARELFAAFARVQLIMPGSRLQRAGPLREEGFDA